MTHADFNDLETRDYIFEIGDRGKAIQARYDENTDALIFPRAAFDYVYKLLKEALSQEQKSGKWIKTDIEHEKIATKGTYTTTIWNCSECGAEPLAEGASDLADYAFSNFCPNCGARMIESQESEE